MDYKAYIVQEFPQGRFLPPERIDAFLGYAKEAAQEEQGRIADAVRRQPWLQSFYQPRDDVRFQIDHMLRITGSQAIDLTTQQGMFEKSRQMLLLTPPGTGSDDTVRGTLYEPWILQMADQMINPDGKMVALPNIIQEMGKPTALGTSAAPDQLYWTNNAFLILDAKCPREPHTTPPDAYVAQLHFYEAALRNLMREKYPEQAELPVYKVLAQGDILRGRVSFLEIPTVPGMADTLLERARNLHNHVCQTQNHWPAPESKPIDKDALTEIQCITQSLLAVRDSKAALDERETELKVRLFEVMGNDPKQWPNLPKEAQFRPSWPRTADNKLLQALREHGIEAPTNCTYDVDAMVVVLRNAGIDPSPFIKDQQVNVPAAVKALEMVDIPRSAVQTPSISLIDKRPPKPEVNQEPTQEIAHRSNRP